jgi:hypothetical protein
MSQVESPDDRLQEGEWNRLRRRIAASLSMVALLAGGPSFADENEELAKKLANPWPA